MGGFEVENRELFIMAHEGQKEARDILFEKNAGLIHHVMKRYKSVIMTYKNIEEEDIYQIGSIGLLKAIDRFDIDYGVCFSTYAVPLIIGEIRQFLRGNSIIKVSRSIKENGYKINKLRESFIKNKGREPNVNEIAVELGISIEDIVTALDAAKAEYAGINGEDNTAVIRNSAGNVMDEPSDTDKESDKVVDRLFLQQLIGRLENDEKKLIILRYFKNRTQTQTASELGLTQVQVSRIEKRLLTQMRKMAVFSVQKP